MSFMDARFAVRGLAIFAIVALAAPLSAADQKKPPKLDKEQQQDVQELVKLTDAAMAGQATPTDLAMTFQPDFLKAQEGKAYVPFVMMAKPTNGKFDSAAAMYIRVVAKAPAEGAAAEATPAKPADGSTQYPFEDVHFVELKGGDSNGYRLTRAFSVPAGEYDVYVALRERTKKKKSPEPLKAGVLKTTVSVPDYWNDNLMTSSVMVANRVEPLAAPLSPDEQLERPYALGSTEIFPVVQNQFKQSQELSVIFLIYNPKLGADNKPNIQVEYSFHVKEGDAEKYFNRTNPQSFNAQTLPPQFDVTAGHQLVAGQSIPLASFPEGDYRMEIKVSDKNSGQTIAKDLKFTVGS